MFFLAATLVGWIRDSVYRKVVAKNIFLDLKCWIMKKINNVMTDEK